GSQRTPGNDLAGRLHCSHIGRVEKARNSDEITVRNQAAECGVLAQRLGAGYRRPYNAAAEVQAIEHLIEYRSIATSPGDRERIEQSISSDFRIVQVHR